MIDSNKTEMATIALYNSAFHTARALLFLDGVKEKSHYCVQKYLESKSTKINSITEFDTQLFDLLRGLRQEVQYELSRFTIEEDLNELYNKTLDFVQRVKKVVQNTSTI